MNLMLIKSKKIFYKDWIYSWLIEKKDYIKESTYANYSNNIFNHINNPLCYSHNLWYALRTVCAIKILR